MNNKSKARIPNNDSTDWQAINIFVFSNGQQHSPPRKYHLQAEDINLWKSTLRFLARTQYGPYHSTVDLFTLDGRRITDPLQLTNGRSYVAVQPPDNFIEAQYDKYLIKASRSWEKRNAKKNENAIEVGKNTYIVPNTDDIEEAPESSNVTEAEENGLLKSIISSTTNHDISTIIKPQLLSTPQGRKDSLYLEQQRGKKRTSIQSPLVVQKITPKLPAPNLRSSFNKRKEYLKSSVKTSKPEERKKSSSMPSNVGFTVNKMSPRTSKTIRPPSKLKDLSILPKVPETVSEPKPLTDIEVISTKNDKMLPTHSGVTDVNNVIKDKELLMASSLYQNPNPEMPPLPTIIVDPSSQGVLYVNTQLSTSKDFPSLAISPVPKQSIQFEPVRELATTTIVNNVKDNSEVLHTDTHIKKSVIDNIDIDNTNNVKTTQSSIHINHNLIQNTRSESISIENIKQYSNLDVKENVEKNVNLFTNDLKTIVSEINDNTITMNTPLRRDSAHQVQSDKRDSEEQLVDNEIEPNYTTNIVKEKISNEITINTSKSSENVKLYSSSPKSSIVTNRVTDSQNITLKIEEIRELPNDKMLNDQYKTTFKKGDVMNLKLNIEIQNTEGSLKRNGESELMNSHSITMMQRNKGSQSNIGDPINTENKSFIPLAKKELKNHNIGDNHPMIIVQCKPCQYCNEYSAANPGKETNKNVFILLPIEQLQLMEERCQCNENQPKIMIASPTSSECHLHSCILLNTDTKAYDIPTNTTTQNICAADKSTENMLLVSRKKSVSINEESTPSKIIQNIDVKTQLISVSVESAVMVKGENVDMVDNWTQTDWCDVLLEASPLRDGHYIFRLPPIELLKLYNLT